MFFYISFRLAATNKSSIITNAKIGLSIEFLKNYKIKNKETLLILSFIKIPEKNISNPGSLLTSKINTFLSVAI